MRQCNKIVLASTSRHKFEEFSALLKKFPNFELITAASVMRNSDKLGQTEKYATYLENASIKARVANQASHYPALSDDTGLEVEALGGKPGVHTHHYATPRAGISQDQANVEKLLTELKGRPMAQRSAKFVTVLAINIEGILLHATGTLEGTIAEAPSGTYGFGYDPIFIPKGSTKTLAELNDFEKNALSHRARALDELMVQIQARGIVFAKP